MNETIRSKETLTTIINLDDMTYDDYKSLTSWIADNLYNIKAMNEFVSREGKKSLSIRYIRYNRKKLEKEIDYNTITSKRFTVNDNDMSKENYGKIYYDNWTSENSHRIIDIKLIDKQGDVSDISVFYYKYKGEN